MFTLAASENLLSKLGSLTVLTSWEKESILHCVNKEKWCHYCASQDPTTKFKFDYFDFYIGIYPNK